MRGSFSVAFFTGLVLLSGCSSQPTLADAEDYLHEGDPRSALAAARSAAERAETSEERLHLRRFAFKASLELGQARDAAKEYAQIRQLLGREDETLLLELGTETFRLANRSSDAARRLLALRNLARVGGLDRVRTLILAGLGDPQPEVRCAALDAVAQLPNPHVALDLLAPRARSEPHAVVRRAAVRAVTGLLPALSRGSPAEQAPAWRSTVVGVAIESVRDPDVEVRLAGLELVEAVGRVDGPRSPALRVALEAAVGNGDDVVARAAAQTLRRLHPKAAIAVWLNAGPKTPAEAPFTRALALTTAEDQARQRVLTDLRAELYATRLAAAQGLSGSGAALCERELLVRVESDPAMPVRAAALEALLSSRARTTPRLRALLERIQRRDPAPAARRLAFLALERLAPPTTAELARLLLAGDPALVTDVADRLASKRDEASQAALLLGLPHPTTRVPALAALRRRGNAAVRETFLALLADRDPRVRILAAQGLATCGEPQDRAQLVRMIEDPRFNADLSAAAALLAIQASARAASTASGTRE